MAMWIYKDTEHFEGNVIWTVGLQLGDDEELGFTPESDHPSKDEAAARVHYLNGGNSPESEADQLLRVATIICAGFEANPRTGEESCQKKIAEWSIGQAAELIHQARKAGGVRSL